MIIQVAQKYAISIRTVLKNEKDKDVNINGGMIKYEKIAKIIPTFASKTVIKSVFLILIISLLSLVDF